MKRKNIFKMFFISMVLLSLTCSYVTAGPEVSATLKAGGGAVGGVGFVMLTGVQNVVSAAYPKISITVVPGGWVGNISRVDVGELDMASTSNTLCAMAEDKVPPLDKPLPNVKSLFNVQDEMFYFMLARKDLPVNSVGELIQKKYPVRLCTLSKGSVTEMTFSSALGTKGVTWDDIKQWGGKVNFVAWADAVSLVKDGHADMICAAGMEKMGWVMELASVRDLKILTWEKEMLSSVNKKLRTVTRTLEKGVYKGIDYDVECPSSSGEIIINGKIPDEVAYAIVKAMAEGQEDYRKQHTAFKSFKAEGMPNDISLPLHPGALKYYKEKGYLK